MSLPVKLQYFLEDLEQEALASMSAHRKGQQHPVADEKILLSYTGDDNDSVDDITPVPKLQPMFTISYFLETMEKWLENNQDRYRDRSGRFRKNLIIARDLRLQGNDQFRQKNYVPALNSYMKAISWTPVDDCYGLEELSRCYGNRALIFCEMKRFHTALLEIDMAIKNCAPSDWDYIRKLHFRKYGMLVRDEIQQYETAAKLLDEIETRFPDDITAVEKEFIQSQRDSLERKLTLRKMNSLNFETRKKAIRKSLKGARIPVLFQPDQSLIESWHENSQSMAETADQVELDHDHQTVVVKKDVPKDQTLVLEHPVAVLELEGNHLHYCQHCLEEISPMTELLIPCIQNCQTVYCSEKCRSDAFTQYHAFECRDYAAMDVWYFMNPATRLLARVLVRVGGPEPVIGAMKEMAAHRRLSASISDSADTTAIWMDNFLQMLHWAMNQIGTKFSLGRESLAKLSLQTILLAKLFADRTPEERADPDRINYLFEILMLFDLVIFEKLAQPITVEPFRVDTENLDLLLELNYQHLIESIRREVPEMKLQKQLEHHSEVIRSGLEGPLLKTIAIGLFPLQLYLTVADGDDAGKSASNVRALANQTYRAWRSVHQLKPSDRLIYNPRPPVSVSELMAKSPLPDAIPKLLPKPFQYDEDGEQILAKFYHEQTSLLDKFPWIKLSLASHLTRYYRDKKDFPQASQYGHECLTLFKPLYAQQQQGSSKILTIMDRLLVVCLVRQARIQFEHFTDDSLPLKESLAVANDCRMQSNQAMVRLYAETVVPINLIRWKKIITTTVDAGDPNGDHQDDGNELNVERHEEWLKKDYVPLMIELEDMLVSADMFIQRFSTSEK